MGLAQDIGMTQEAFNTIFGEVVQSYLVHTHNGTTGEGYLSYTIVGTKNTVSGDMFSDNPEMSLVHAKMMIKSLSDDIKKYKTTKNNVSAKLTGKALGKIESV